MKEKELRTLGRAALLDLQIVGQTEHVFLDWGQTDQLRDLSPDLIQRAGVGGGQQVKQRGWGGIVQVEEQALRAAVRVTVPVSGLSVCRQYSLRARKMRSHQPDSPAAPFWGVHWAATQSRTSAPAARVRPSRAVTF